MADRRLSAGDVQRGCLHHDSDRRLTLRQSIDDLCYRVPAFADCRDRTRGFGAWREWPIDRVQTFAIVDLDEVHPDCFDIDEQLTRTGPGIGHVFELQNFGAAFLMDANNTIPNSGWQLTIVAKTKQKAAN